MSMTGGGSMRLAPGNNISIGGEQPVMEKPSDMVVHRHRRNNNNDANSSNGNPAVSPGGSSNGSVSDGGSNIRRHAGGGHESPVSISSCGSNSWHDDRHSKIPAKSSSFDPSSSDDQQELITKLHHHDCILGRGGFTNNYIGNANFRKLVNQHKMRYLSCNKIEKPKVARDVVRLWKQMDPPGRFLIKKESDVVNSRKGDPIVWVPCSDKKAQEKASQSLRERTPDVLPYLSKLQEHREQMREQGLSLISQHYQDSLKGSEHFPTDSGHGSMSSPGDPRRDTSMGDGVGGGNGGLHHPHSSFGHPGMDQSMNSSMNRSMDGSGHLPPPMIHSGMDYRRMSMPADGGAAGRSAVPVTPGEMRSQMAAARRTSMPTINHLQGGGIPGIHHHHHRHHHHPHPDHQHSAHGMMGGNHGMMPFDMERQRQQVLQEAYSAVERHGGVDPQTNRMFMEEMMMREHELMQQHQALVRGHHMMQAMQNPPFIGSMGGVTRDCDVMMPEHQSMLIAAAQKQQQLLHESMKETIIEKHRAEVIKQQQKEKEHEKKFQPPSQNNKLAPSQEQSQAPQRFARPQHPGDSGFDIEPLPIDVDAEEYAVPLSTVPEVAKSNPQVSARKDAVASTAKSSLKKSPPAKKNPGGSAAKKVKEDGKNPASVPGPQVPPDSTLPLNDTLSGPPVGTPGKLKSAFKKSTTSVPRDSIQSNSSDSAVNEYRKTLEDYMMNHQNAAAVPGAVDIDDDISDSEGDMGGVDASAWIQQALNSSGETSMKNNDNKRKKKRRGSRQDLHAGGLKDETNHDSTGFASTHTTNTLDLMSTDGKSVDCGKSMDCKSLECMSFLSLAMSEMEKSMEQLHVDKTPPPPPKGVATGPSNDDDSDMLEDESINFGSPNGELRKRGGMSSNQSVMSELTDFSGNEDSDNEDGLGFERDTAI